ncbi:hypothetical protein C8J31_13027 [Rhizobium sp. PP-CC-2G-626]|nr:hypothetical protein C8J31_13027 [Rhizobium sp. PP-CC-2G-626]
MLGDIFEVLWETVRILTFQPRNDSTHRGLKFRESQSRKSDFWD